MYSSNDYKQNYFIIYLKPLVNKIRLTNLFEKLQSSKQIKEIKDINVK